MTTIIFKQGNIFEKCIGIYDLCLYYGHYGMSFGMGYNTSINKFPILVDFSEPFGVGPITLDNGKVMVCIQKDLMSNTELEDDLINRLNYAKFYGLKTIALTGVRDSLKVGITDINIAKENDNNRVRFIVDVLTKWLKNNNSEIKEILLIAMSDNYTRNFREPINVA